MRVNRFSLVSDCISCELKHRYLTVDMANVSHPVKRCILTMTILGSMDEVGRPIELKPGYVKADCPLKKGPITFSLDTTGKNG
jgi:hypothetical protein